MGADFSTSLMLSLVHGPLSPVPRRTEEAEAYDDLGAPLSVLRDEQELATKPPVPRQSPFSQLF